MESRIAVGLGPIPTHIDELLKIYVRNAVRNKYLGKKYIKKMVKATAYFWAASFENHAVNAVAKNLAKQMVGNAIEEVTNMRPVSWLK